MHMSGQGRGKCNEIERFGGAGLDPREAGGTAYV